MRPSINQEIIPPVSLEITDSKVGLTGWLAIDSLVNGHCHGGLGMASHLSLAELTELAKMMTLKFGFLGIPHGGAKAGIVCSESLEKERKLQLLTAFGTKIRHLLVDWVYVPGTDIGTTNGDIRYMFETVGVSIPKRTLRGERSGYYTALTTIASAKIAATHLGFELAQATLAVEGFGKVGSAVAQEIHRLGSKVVAISTSQGALYSPHGLDVPQLLAFSQKYGSNLIDHYHGAEKINREDLLEIPVDVLLPCARPYTISLEKASHVKARLISPGANLPLTEEAEEYLYQRGVLSVPDFVANSGGVLGGTMEFAGVPDVAISNFISRDYANQVALILEESRTRKDPPRKVAREIALERFSRVRALSAHASVRSKAFTWALELYRNGLIPRIFVGPLAEQFFRRRITGTIEPLS